MHVHSARARLSRRRKRLRPARRPRCAAGLPRSRACRTRSRRSTIRRRSRSCARAAAAAARCRVYPIGAITPRAAGDGAVRLSHELADAGAVAFSDDGDTVANARVLRDAALARALIAGAFISHCEDPGSQRRRRDERRRGRRRARSDRQPAIAEDAIVARDLLLASDTGKRLAHRTRHDTRVGLDLDSPSAQPRRPRHLRGDAAPS